MLDLSLLLVILNVVKKCFVIIAILNTNAPKTIKKSLLTHAQDACHKVLFLYVKIATIESSALIAMKKFIKGVSFLIIQDQ